MTHPIAMNAVKHIAPDRWVFNGFMVLLLIVVPGSDAEVLTRRIVHGACMKKHSFGQHGQV